MRKISVNGLSLETGRPCIAVPVTGITHEEIVEQCRHVMLQPCDIIEWRVDYYLSGITNLAEQLDNNEVHLEIIRILDDIDYITDSKPVIFTIRTTGQGGKISLDTDNIQDLSALAAQSKLVSFVDIELFDENDELDEVQITKRINEIHDFNVKVIMSYHDFKRMPEAGEIKNLVTAMRALGADICKIAAMASEKRDAMLMLKCAEALTKGDQSPVIMIAMGRQGLASRVAGGKYGSCITFAAGQHATAPGQLTAGTLNRLLNEYYKA